MAHSLYDHKENVMDEFTAKFSFHKDNPPQVGQQVMLSRDLMGFGVAGNKKPLEHNHAIITRIVPSSERSDKYTRSGMYFLVEVKQPDGTEFKAYCTDLTPLI